MKRNVMLIILFIILLAPATFSKECQREMQPSEIPCQVISTFRPSDNCANDSNIIQIYNSTGVVIQNQTWGEYPPVCNITFNITTNGVYHYNSSIETGVITIEGDRNEMILSLTIFLLLINLVVFLIPFIVKKFPMSPAGNYLVKRLIWIASMIFLWFNLTLFRTLADTQGLDIDNFLKGYWWIATIGIFFCIFLIVYFTAIGMTKLMQEAITNKRMGYEEDGEY